MVNEKPAVYTALCQVATNISDEYPTDWATFPVIQYTSENNRENTTLLDGTEDTSYIRFRIDIWMKASTSSACLNVTTKIKELGYVRTDCIDVNDPSGLRHSVLRFEKYIDQE